MAIGLGRATGDRHTLPRHRFGRENETKGTIMATTDTSGKPTRWDLSNIYSGLEGDDYREAVARLKRELTDCEAFYETVGIGRLPSPPEAANDRLAESLHEVIRRANDLARLAETLQAFVYGFFSADSADPTAAREKSKLEMLDTRRQKLAVRRQGWIGSLAPLLDELIAGDELLATHEYYLRHTARESRYLMPEPLEGLAADLCLDGAVAFSNLQTKVTSQLEVPLEHDGRFERLPIAQVQNFRFSADGQLRRRAHEAEIKGWKSIATTVAACMSAIKGTARTLELRRGRGSVLEVALEQNRIDGETLDALLGAIRESLPVFRRYLKCKARKLGHEALPWWDLFAPADASAPTFGWDEARRFIVKQFATFSPEMADMAQRAFERRWIDGEPRRGKAGGAFCMEVVGVEESRVLANFDGSFEQVSTLAHELGHAFHNHCQRGLEPLLRGSPMTLAETASIFCETLIAEAAVVDAERSVQLAILESQLIGATQVCLDISSRFLFESAVFERRGSGELGPDELCDLMREAQRQTYAEAVDPATYHPYMWLWKPHYYEHTTNFYNFPYAFGQLFALGLFEVYGQSDGDFVDRYKDLLRDTGRDDARPLAARFGIDIATLDFWRRSLRVIESQVERYEALSTG